MKTNLAKILWKKEVQHWKRTFSTLKKVNNWVGKFLIGIILLTVGNIVHYAFVLMSTAWESLLWVVARKQFKTNLQRMALTVI